jgi:hypothetical protein
MEVYTIAPERSELSVRAYLSLNMDNSCIEEVTDNINGPTWAMYSASDIESTSQTRTSCRVDAIGVTVRSATEAFSTGGSAGGHIQSRRVIV